MAMQIGWLRALTERLDERLRFRDLRTQRTVGGRLERLCGVSRHTLPALLLPVVLAALLILGSPSWRRSWMAALTGGLVAIVVARLMRVAERQGWTLRIDLFVQAGVILAIAVALWVFAPGQYSERGLYSHVLVPLAVVLAVALIAAGTLVVTMFGRMRQESCYGTYLRKTELFASRGPAPSVTLGTVLTAVVVVFVRAPLALLILPALATLVSAPVWLPVVPAGVFGVCFFALLIGGVNERFGSMWSRILAPLVRGGAAIVSTLLITFAVLRLAGVSYVTTVFDTMAWRTLGATLAGAYVLSWWYDYWASRLLSDQLMRMLHPRHSVAQIPYDIDQDSIRTGVPRAGRVLQIHGAGRFLALNETPEHQFFQAHTMPDLLELLAVSGAPGGKAVPTPLQVLARMANFHTVSAAVAVFLMALGIWWINKGPQWPEVEIQSTESGIALPALLRRLPTAADRPLILVAASGGGTRAALYTASVLEGLAESGRAADIVLASGVSGGGAALAYFAANRPTLATAALDPAAWTRYFDTMRQPFIQDVLDRASELRMVGPGRTGTLLSDSFKARWRLPPDRRLLADVDDIGLIFNTSLAGHLELPNASGARLADVEPTVRATTKSTLAGGRLLLTNLVLPSALAQTPLEPGVKIPLPVIIRSPTLRLEEAAALNANFPPVFSNAAIDVDRRVRYWVTDGGAVDNRGLETLLYALRFSLDALGTDHTASLPPIHVVIIDASSHSDDYSQDRGIGSAFGAGSRFASHLNAELVASIRGKYGAHADRFGYSYVMMPDLLRTSGSFGTHWMLQSRIRVGHGTEHRAISGDEMIRILRALHTSVGGDLAGSACDVLAWAREDPSYREGWLRLLETLRITRPASPCRLG